MSRTKGTTGALGESRTGDSSCRHRRAWPDRIAMSFRNALGIVCVWAACGFPENAPACGVSVPVPAAAPGEVLIRRSAGVGKAALEAGLDGLHLRLGALSVEPLFPPPRCAPRPARGADDALERWLRVRLPLDADVDGAHIRTLLLTLFYRYFEQLITNGHVYIAQPPLFKIQAGRESKYAFTEEEKEKIVEMFKGKSAEQKAKVEREKTGGKTGGKTKKDSVEGGEEKEELKGIVIQRYKGLGEMNPQQLWETTMNPQSRIMKKVSIEDAQQADTIFEILMGNEVEPRKKFIQTHAKAVKNLDV